MFNEEVWLLRYSDSYAGVAARGILHLADRGKHGFREIESEVSD